MGSAGPKGSFGRHRKIMPFEPGSIEALRDASRRKAASLNQHVLGYGAQGLNGLRQALPRPIFLPCVNTGWSASAPS